MSDPSDTTPDRSDPSGSEAKSRWIECGVLGTVTALVIGIYLLAAQPGPLDAFTMNASDAYYNLLVQGFRAGHLSLSKEAPPGLAQLADPYDPSANARYRPASDPLIDLSYYKGRLFLYWGVTPALILFWPFVKLTGHYLFHRQAVTIFCAIGFLAGAGLLRALWRRYFPEVNFWVVVTCIVAFGLATSPPMLLPQSDVYEVPITCGYMLLMLTLGAIWRALHETEPRKRSGWLAAASAAYGLALGARPNLLFGAVILLVPVVHGWRERGRFLGLLTAAIVPITIIGSGLMLYNARRFDNPFEFGWHYQLGPLRQDRAQLFSPRYLWLNFRVYFLEPARWSSQFPFVHEFPVPSLPRGYHGAQMTFGVLSNLPLVWLAPTLLSGLVWRARSADSRSRLDAFLAAVALLFGISAMTMTLFFAARISYMLDFLPTLVLLALVGILGLEQALVPPGARPAPNAFGAGLSGSKRRRPGWRYAVRGGWGLLLGFSVVFNLLVGTVNYAKAQYYVGVALDRVGNVQRAMARYEWALRIKPDLAEAHNGLGVSLAKTGKLQEAIEHYEQALRLKPDLAEAQYSLGSALATMGKLEDAAGHFEQAVRIEPDYAEAHNDLGVALLRLGRTKEATGQWEQALRIKPDFAEAHYNRGLALEQTGKTQEAIADYEQALQIKPDLLDTKDRLARLRAGQ